jgi:hypothetical protein
MADFKSNEDRKKNAVEVSYRITEIFWQARRNRQQDGMSRGTFDLSGILETWK